ncbi:uncharacterized protein LOC113778402 isoform X1 [Coffea eugenioides]|uniref:uncharacterized protein LOC113778402 isoform X1 n=1 Tax=Coffea eugenioides TaxID=49369 RepID=UPI000F60ED52|nr:uncharacterized protein LOC113778402 isoform X1 [Coffea eugenioides]
MTKKLKLQLQISQLSPSFFLSVSLSLCCLLPSAVTLCFSPLLPSQPDDEEIEDSFSLLLQITMVEQKNSLLQINCDPCSFFSLFLSFCFLLPSLLIRRYSLSAKGTQKLTAYSSQQTSLHPHISLLVEAASNEEAEKFERGFILQLLGSTSSTNTSEFLKLSAADYIKNFDPSLHTFPPREQLQHQYCSEAGPVI